MVNYINIKKKYINVNMYNGHIIKIRYAIIVVYVNINDLMIIIFVKYIDNLL